jgi:hypothetical protein
MSVLALGHSLAIDDEEHIDAIEYYFAVQRFAFLLAALSGRALFTPPLIARRRIGIIHHSLLLPGSRSQRGRVLLSRLGRLVI